MRTRATITLVWEYDSDQNPEDYTEETRKFDVAAIIKGMKPMSNRFGDCKVDAKLEAIE